MEIIINNAINSMKEERSLPVGGFSLPLPCFFPSISSVKTNLSPLEYLRVIVAVNYPQFLISAYDINNCSLDQRQLINSLIKDAIRNKKVVLCDSGNFESFWKEDEDWDVEIFGSILELSNFQMAFCFDHQELLDSVEETIDLIVNAVLRDQQRLSNGTVIPIIHASSEMLPGIAYGVAERLNPVLIAVPERRLGEGIINRAKTVFKIRESLNKTGQYYPLHLLGTGNPLSILIYSLCRADSFDGLEWCQTTVDHKTALLYHFQQREFLGNQTTFCTVSNLPYAQSTLAHNLLFYHLWMKQIQNTFVSGNTAEFVEKYLPEPFLKLLRGQLPGIL